MGKKIKFSLCFMATFLMLFSGVALAQNNQNDKKEGVVQETAPETIKVNDTKANEQVNPYQKFNDLKALKNPKPEEIFEMGVMYEHGVGTYKNYTSALEMYTKASEAGLAEGSYNASVFYEVGMGTAQDNKKCFDYMKKASEAGLAQADYRLASFYLTDQFTKKDEKKSLELIKKAAKAKHVRAQADLGAIYATGSLGAKIDRKLAIENLTTASEGFFPEAMKNLAVVYKDGIGGAEKNYEEALKWYLIAAQFGYPINAIQEALNEISDKISDEQVKKAHTESSKWYESKTGQKSSFTISEDSKKDTTKK